MGMNVRAGESKDFFINGINQETGTKDGKLAPSHSVKVTSANPSLLSISLDRPARVSPTGVQSIISGRVTAQDTPNIPNGPIQVTATIYYSDGSEASIASDNVNILPSKAHTVAPEHLLSEGELFGPGVHLSIPPESKRDFSRSMSASSNKDANKGVNKDASASSKGSKVVGPARVMGVVAPKAKTA